MTNTAIPTTFPPVTGVDTHTDTHTVAAVTATGQHLATETFPATTAGYKHLASFLNTHSVDTVGVRPQFLRGRTNTPSHQLWIYSRRGAASDPRGP